MSEEAAAKAEECRIILAGIRDFVKEYEAHPDRFNDADLAVFKGALEWLQDNLHKGPAGAKR